MEPYAALARYYDYENADFTEDLDFWLELAEAAGGPVLEVGCGTGRVLLNLARRGHAVTGIDNAPEMLARLEQKRAASRLPAGTGPIRALRADMTDFALGEQFALAILPFNTFMHLATPEAQIAALTCLRGHLKDGGLLALDMPNPGQAYASQEQGLVLERAFAVPEADGEHQVQQFSSVVIDRSAQLARITWLYDSLAPDGSLRRLVVPLRLRYTFPGEMRLLLERCGFSLDGLYGDYDRSPFADDSPRMIVLAEAAGTA